MEQLKQDGNYNEYLEPEVPFCFIWIYSRFLELYNYSGESVTWTSIESYAKIRNIKFTQIEVEYLMKMVSWSNSKIQELRTNEE